MHYNHICIRERRSASRKIILFFLLVAFFINGFSQNNNAAHITKSEEIAKARRILLDKFIENDKLGIMLEMDRLMLLDSKDYLALYPIEFWLLSYWISDYQPILASLKDLKFDSLPDKSIRIPPQEDYLIAKLIEKCTEQEDTLLRHIENSKLTGEEKDFLIIGMKYFLGANTSQNNKQEVFNALADNFLDQYPGSEYEAFIKKYIRIKYEVTKNGFAYSLYSGKFLFSGNLTEYYKHPTLVGFTLEVIHNNWVYQLNLGVGFSKTKKDMLSNNEVWPQNSKAIGGMISLSAGKYIFDSKRFAIAPLAGIGIFGLDPNSDTNKEPDYKGAGIKTTIAGNIGFISDLKLRTKDFINGDYFSQGTSTTSLRIGYEYIVTPLKSRYIDYSGTVHKVTIGVGLSSRRVQRSY